MNSISAVLFDLGNVLVRIDFDAFPRSLGIDRTGVNYADETTIEMTAIQYETGRITTEQFLDSLDKIFHHKFTRQQILAAWNAIIEEENSALGPIVNTLQARYETAILSNTSPTHFQKAMNASPIIRRLPKRYLSYEMGAMKPDSAVYEHVINDLKTKPSTILFIDDISENVIAARKSGMEGILFRDAPQLGSELRSRKIL